MRSMCLTLLCVGVLMGVAPASAADPPMLTLGTVRAAAGQIAWVPITLHGADVLGAQLDLLVPPEAQVATADGAPLCVFNPAIGRGWSHADFGPHLPVRCTPRADCTRIRLLTLELSERIREPIPDGAVLAHCAVRAPAEGAVAIGCAGAVVARPDVLTNPDAEGLAVACVPGAVEAVAGCAVGDLDGSGTITVDEVLGAVAAALEGCR